MEIKAEMERQALVKSALWAAFVVSAATPALADDWDFVLINNTGKPIHAVEVAPAGTTEWQPNKIDAEEKHDVDLKPGGKLTVHFDKGPGCKYDLKANFADGSSQIWSGMNVCDNAYITIRFNASSHPIFTQN